MNQPRPTASGERIIETMIELARCSKFHRIIVAGPKSPHLKFELHRRGYNRVATTATCGLPRGQFDVALVDWQLQSLRALETTLDWLVHFLNRSAVLVIRIDSQDCAGNRPLASMLEGLGFRIEVGTRCERGVPFRRGGLMRTSRPLPPEQFVTANPDHRNARYAVGIGKGRFRGCCRAPFAALPAVPSPWYEGRAGRPHDAFGG
jgi:hypothetical protein